MNFFLLNLANLHHVLRICMIFFLFVSIILQNKIFYNFKTFEFYFAKGNILPIGASALYIISSICPYTRTDM